MSLHCDYQFKILKIGSANYRVPVLNKQNTGKILETKGKDAEGQEEEVFGSRGAGKNQKSNANKEERKKGDGR